MPETSYRATVLENGKPVGQTTGTLNECAAWAENNIRWRGDCEIRIEMVTEHDGRSENR